jgi:hypothetical protein
MGSSFYRTAAAASFCSAITTLGLIFLPDLMAPVEDFAGRMQRVTDPAYRLRSWIYLVHPFLVFTAMLGIGLALRHSTPARALTGTIAMGVWALTEAGPQTLTHFAFDKWRHAWLAGDTAIRSTMELRSAIYEGLWDAAYGLLLIGFLIGHTLYAWALITRHERLSRVVAIFLLLAALLTVALLIREFGGPNLLAPFGRWAYPTIQPLGRVLIGVWLWRVAQTGAARLQARA